jgi:hypothetical protein
MARVFPLSRPPSRVVCAVIAIVVVELSQGLQASIFRELYTSKETDQLPASALTIYSVQLTQVSRSPNATFHLPL